MNVLLYLVLILLAFSVNCQTLSGSDVPFTILSHEQRQTAIEQAPTEQKEELRKLDRHLLLVKAVGSEEKLKELRESCVAEARGFGALSTVFAIQKQVWQGYTGLRITDHSVSKLSKEAQSRFEQQLSATQDAKVAKIREREKVVHAIVFRLAKTSEALALENQTKTLSETLTRRLNPEATTSFHPITDAELVRIDQQFDEIFGALQKLPLLSQEQLQKEYNDFSEDNIPLGGPEG